MAKNYLDFDFFISFSGILTFKRADEVRDAAKKIPLNRILIETDSPYLSPVPFRGKTNEPGNVVYVAEMLAEVRNTGIDELQEQLIQNTLELFPKVNQ